MKKLDNYWARRHVDIVRMGKLRIVNEAPGGLLK